jgi:hypothetical protein
LNDPFFFKIKVLMLSVDQRPAVFVLL